MIPTSPQPIEPFNQKRNRFMANFTTIRSTLFRIGIAAAALAALNWPTAYFHKPDTADYLKQSVEALPWIDRGLFLSLAAVVLCGFGRSWQRWAGITSSIALLCFWILIAESNF
jgi:hypothetical protein